MSYIDQFDHEHIGFMAGLPIYRPLETYIPEDTLDGQFSCSPNTLVLGGGYLEHPGLVIRDLNYAVATFLSDWINYCEDTKSAIYPDVKTDKWIRITYDYMFGKDKFKVLDPTHWSMRDYSEFYIDCKSGGMQSPFIETESYNEFENWLISNFGELVTFSYPELITDKKLKLIAEKTDRYLYGNIHILPAGYPTDHLGRLTKNGKIVMGNRAWKVTKNI